MFANKKTFRPTKEHNAKTLRLSKLSQQTLATLGAGGNMRTVVQLPPGEDLNEWLAANTVDFFNEISLLYGAVTEFCTPESCPVMSAGKKVEYLWADGVKVKKPVKLSAPEYVDNLMTWVEGLLNDESVFPLGAESKFPKNFVSTVKNIFKRLFRVYAHLYHNHFESLKSLGAEAHLNTSCKHFVFFTDAFDLVEARELLPLKDLVDRFLGEHPKPAGDHHRPKVVPEPTGSDDERE